MTNENVWIEKLDNPTLSVLPHDFLRPQQEPYTRQATYSLQLPQLDVPHETFSNKYAVALSVWAALLYRVTGDDDIVLYIANNKILRFNILPTWTFNELYSAIITELSQLESIKADFSFDDLAEKIQSYQDLERTPQLFRLAFLENQDFNLDQFKHHLVDFALNLETKNNTHVLNLIYNSLLYSNERVTIVADQFTQYLTCLLYTSRCV